MCIVISILLILFIIQHAHHFSAVLDFGIALFKLENIFALIQPVQFRVAGHHVLVLFAAEPLKEQKAQSGHSASAQAKRQHYLHHCLLRGPVDILYFVRGALLILG